MKNMIKIILIMMFITSCKTTSLDQNNVDQSRNEVTIYSSNDDRSTLAENNSSKSMKTIIMGLKEEANSKSSKANASVYLDIAQANLINKSYKNAIKYCQMVLRHDLRNLKAKKILSEAYFRSGKIDMASVILANMGSKKVEKDPDLLNLQALVFLNKKENDKTMFYLQKAIRHFPNNVAARMNLGTLFIKYKQYTSSIAQFQRVLSIMPSNLDAKLQLANAYSNINKMNMAIKSYEEILDRDEQNPIALYNLSAIYKEKKDYDRSLDYLEMYSKSKRIMKSDSKQVLATMRSLQNLKEQNKNPVSDDTIRVMAASLEKNTQPQKKTYTAKSSKDRIKKVKKTKKTIIKNNKKHIKKVIKVKKKKVEPSPELDDISSLENTLTQ